jgi:hypothetical protein
MNEKGVFHARLDRWLALRIRGESAAIDTVTAVCKNAIEEETPLYYQLVNIYQSNQLSLSVCLSMYLRSASHVADDDVLNSVWKVRMCLSIRT